MLRERRDHVDRGGQPVAHGGGQRRHLVGGPDARPGSASASVSWVSASARAQPGGLAGEVATDLLGVQVGLGEQVADAGQREVPAVARGAQELLQHRQLDGGVGRLVDDVDPAEEGGDVVGPGAREHLVDGDVRVDAGRDLAEDLQQRVLAEGDRGVGLLAGEQRRVRLGVELVPGARGGRRRSSAVTLPSAAAANACSHSAIASRSCTASYAKTWPPSPSSSMPDERVVEALLPVLGVERERHLVELGLALGVRDLHQLDDDREVRRRARQRADAA